MCILWPNGDAKVFGTFVVELTRKSVMCPSALSKERLRYVKVWYLIDGNIFVRACIHDALLFASILSFAQGLRKLIREIVSVANRNIYDINIDTDVTRIYINSCQNDIKLLKKCDIAISKKA